jgi:hypothetical protein
VLVDPTASGHKEAQHMKAGETGQGPERPI